MKRWVKPSGVIILYLLVPLFLSANDPKLKDFSIFVRSAMNDWSVPGLAIAIVGPEGVIYSETFGYRDLEKRLPVTVNTRFPIGSCTKAFTATVLGMLVDEGILHWDAPVRSYLPDFKLSDPYITEHITIRDLLTHISGLPRHEYVWLGTPFSREDLLRRIQFLPFSKGFRETYQYNNLLYVVAGMVVEAVTGSSWEDEVYRRILLPLGMTATNFSIRDMQQTEDYALAYTVSERGHAFAPFREIDAIGPAGSINSTLRDMAKWIQFNLNDGIVMLDTLIMSHRLQEIHSPWVITGNGADDPELSFNSYGLGWRVSSYRGHRIVYHTGAIGGFRAKVVLVPHLKLGIVSLANVNRSQINTVVAYNAIDRLLDLDQINWSRRLKQRMGGQETVKCDASPLLTQPLDAYTGTYTHPAYGDITIERRGHRLVVNRYGTTSNLIPCTVDTFYREPGHWGVFRSRVPFSFRPNEEGEIDRVLIPLERSIDDIVFLRKK